MSFNTQDAVIGHGFAQFIGLGLVGYLFSALGLSFDAPLPDFWTVFYQVYNIAA